MHCYCYLLCYRCAVFTCDSDTVPWLLAQGGRQPQRPGHGHYRQLEQDLSGIHTGVPAGQRKSCAQRRGEPSYQWSLGYLPIRMLPNFSSDLLVYHWSQSNLKCG